MNITDFITQYNIKDYSLKKLTNALTNQVYKLSINDKHYVIRISNELNNKLFDRKLEKHVISLVKDFDCETIYYNEENGLKISIFLDNCTCFQECILPNKIELFAEVLSSFHNKNISVDQSFNILKTYNNFKDNTDSLIYNLNKYEYILDDIDQYEPKILCHNDLVSGNILYQENRCYLIDYEYAKNNHSYFDVMSFITENNLSDSDRIKFYNAYFKKDIDQYQISLLTKFENAHNLLWCMWAMMMYSHKKELIYLDIAKTKYENLIKIADII